MTLLFVVLLIAGSPFLPWLPVVVLVSILLAVFSTGLAMALSVLAVYFRDMSYLWAIISQIWFWATPIVYPPSLLAEKAPTWVYNILKLNPMNGFVEVYRRCLYDRGGTGLAHDSGARSHLVREPCARLDDLSSHEPTAAPKKSESGPTHIVGNATSITSQPMAASPKPTQDDVEAPAPSARQRGGRRVTDGERQATELQLLQLRDQLIGAEAKLGELREQVERLKARCQRTEDLCELKMANAENELALGRMYETQLEMVLASTTWRVGRVIVKPTFALKRALRIS